MISFLPVLHCYHRASMDVYAADIYFRILQFRYLYPGILFFLYLNDLFSAEIPTVFYACFFYDRFQYLVFD